MEKYSKHLETLVADRTADLILEKQKTDRLLYSTRTLHSGARLIRTGLFHNPAQFQQNWKNSFGLHNAENPHNSKESAGKSFSNEAGKTVQRRIMGVQMLSDTFTFHLHQFSSLPPGL